MPRKISQCIRTIDEWDIGTCSRLGLGVEIQDFTEPNLDQSELDELVQRYKARFAQFPGTKSMHGPFLDLKPGSPDPWIRAASQRRYRKALQIAAELSVDFIVFHSQINPQLTEPFLADLNNRQSREAWLEILGETGDFRGTIVIENVFEPKPDMLKALVETIALPNVKINLDLGHAKLGMAPLADWIRELKDHIAYIHLHSNDGIHDLHHRAPSAEIASLCQLLDHYGLDPVIAMEYPVEDLAAEYFRLMSI